jgi:hypothetical protein
MAPQAGKSRVCAGIHCRSDLDDGIHDRAQSPARDVGPRLPADRPFGPAGH